MPACSVKDQYNLLALSCANTCSKVLERDGKNIHIDGRQEQPVGIS